MTNDNAPFFGLSTVPTLPDPVPARHSFPYDGYEFAPMLFNFHPDHRGWEATAYLLESELMYGKVIQAWGRGPHDEMPDFAHLLAVCSSTSEVLVATLARDLWSGEGPISGMLDILDDRELAGVREAMRIARI